MDLKLSNDSKHLYCLDSSNFMGNIGGDPSAPKNSSSGMCLMHIDVDSVNLNPNIKPVLIPKNPVPSTREQKPQQKAYASQQSG